MKKFIVANWKMNPSILMEAKRLFLLVNKGIKNINNAEIIICPPFLYIPKTQNKKYKIKIGAQNCFWENSGAFTGEISPLMLKDLGVEYVILGHSERRKYFFETDEMINKKIKAVLAQNLKVILCIGETEKERKAGKVKEVLKEQIFQDLKDIENSKQKIKNLILAYEPVWAIGTGNACLPQDAKEVLIFLKSQLKNVPILYGGSVNSENAQNYIKVGFDGLLVGGASLKAEEFIKIVKNIN